MKFSAVNSELIHYDYGNINVISSTRAINLRIKCLAFRVITQIAGYILDLALVIDCSGSIRKANPPGVDNWQFIIDFMADLVSRLHIDRTTTRVGAVTFGTRLRRFCHLVVVTVRYAMSPRNCQ